ncbi:FecR family protein [Pedobacter sp. AW31-3R]|uniref:FecR family protein n=1 Tax=Pedobacter sp. AW31-3R TaxID=3445781 RepID=UPI003F9F7C2D
MENEKLIYLIKRHVQNLNTTEEQTELFQLIHEANNLTEFIRHMEEVWEEEHELLVMDDALSKRIFNNVLAADPTYSQGQDVQPIQVKQERTDRKMLKWLTWAAAVLVIGFSILWYQYPSHKNQGSIPATGLTKAVAAQEHKKIFLPDGSTVILNVNSTLEYPEHFNGTTREVTLNGEGYFDIKRKPGQQFIVHAGKLQTVVLGTAFNIRTINHNKQITVTVTRGKVSVQRDQEVLGVLTPNQQIVFHDEQKVTKSMTVKAKEVVAWQEHDLFFEDITMEEAASLLAQRFNVTIRFKGDEGKKCRFSAVFLKRQQLKEILDVITAFNNASYITESGIITISGKNCSN